MNLNQLFTIYSPSPDPRGHPPSLPAAGIIRTLTHLVHECFETPTSSPATGRVQADMAPIKSTGAAFTRGRQKRLATVYPKQDLQVPCLPSLWSTLGSWWLQDPGGGQGTAGAGGVREGFPNFSCYIFHEPLPLYFWLSYLCYLDILLLSLALPLSGYCRHTDFRPSHCPNFPPICCVLILSCPSGRLFSLIPRTCAQPGIHLFSLLPWFSFSVSHSHSLH